MPSTFTDQPEVTMILTAYNLGEPCYTCYRHWDYDLNRAELIVVDGGSSDSIVRMLRDFLSRHGSKFGRSELIIHDRNYGVSRARNDGIRASRAATSSFGLN